MKRIFHSFFLLTSFFILSCLDTKNKYPEIADTVDKPNLYDKIFIKMLKTDKSFSEISNVDSLYEISNTAYFFDLPGVRKVLDSTTIDSISKTKPLDIDIKISDSLVTLIKQKGNKNLKVEYSFSKPYWLNENRVFIISHVLTGPISNSDGIFFLKKDENNSWKVESSEFFNNYSTTDTPWIGEENHK